MYTERDFRKDFPQNTMLKNIREKAFTKSLLRFNLINAVFATAYVGIAALLMTKIAPTDLHETRLKMSQAQDMNQQYIDMREKYDVDHEDIVGLI